MYIGQLLAMCEVYVPLHVGQLFRRFNDLVASDIGPEDMVYEDYFSLFHPAYAGKLQVIHSSRVDAENSNGDSSAPIHSIIRCLNRAFMLLSKTATRL